MLLQLVYTRTKDSFDPDRPRKHSSASMSQYYIGKDSQFAKWVLGIYCWVAVEEQEMLVIDQFIIVDR